MPTPSPRNSIRIARGNIADLQLAVSDIGEGELCFAIDENRFYSKSSGVLVPVGGGTELISVDQMGDVDVTTVAPVNGQVLSWDGINWVPESLGTAAATDTTDYATAAQGALADTATQPGDLATVATSGSYDDLADQPVIPVIDPNTVVTDEVPTFTATVQTTERTITAGAFDLATGNHWTCGAITVPAPSNAISGTSGLIRITAGPVVWNTVFKFPGGVAPTIASFPAIIPFYVHDSSNILMGSIVEGIS